MEEKQLFYFDELDLKEIGREFIRKLWIIIPVMLFVMMLTWTIFSSREKVQYTSNATIVVLSQLPSEEESELSVSTGMAKALAKVLSSDILKKRLKAEYGYEFTGTLSAAWITNTNLVQLQMTSDAAEEAQQNLQVILDNCDSFSNHILSKADMFIVSEPSIPLYPSNQGSFFSPAKLAVIAAIAVGMICALLIFMRSVLRKTVKTKACADRRIQAKVYGSIGDSSDKSIKWLVSRIIYHMEQKKQQVLMITSTARDEGQEDAAFHIADTLAGRGKDVLLVSTGTDSPENGYRVFRMNRQLEMKEAAVDSDQIRDYLIRQRENTDYIIVIAPPVGMPEQEALLQMSDTSLLVIRLDYQPVDAINNTIVKLTSSRIELMGCVLSSERRCPLFNRVDHSNKLI